MHDEIIFAKTRHVYESYTDFWKLVSLAGFKTIYVDEIDISKEGIYITAPMNRDWRLHINNEHQKKKPVNAHLILWNLERPDGSTGSVPEYARQNRYLQYGRWENGRMESGDDTPIKSYGRFIDDVWVSDQRLADETGAHFIVLGSHPGLGEPGQDKHYDYCHMSAENGRRQSVYYHRALRDKTMGPNCWPPQRDEVLKATRFALNVHQDNHPFQEPLRFALFAAYGLPILSETVFDATPWVNTQHIIFNDIVGMPEKLNQMLDNDYERWREMGLRARQMMTEEYEFGKVVRETVANRVNRWR